ncbi:hypothetical protein FRC07_014046 [Ceratobasidium sp. 392]|nr:hypothetical protein FRC07_014046 [Ceratobasidium sp. 392]
MSNTILPHPATSDLLLFNCIPSPTSLVTGESIESTQLVSNPMDSTLKVSVESAQVSESESIAPDDASIASDSPPSKKAVKKRAYKKRKKNAKATDAVQARKQNAEARVAALESILDAAESVPPTMVCPKAAPASHALYSRARDVFWFTKPVNTNCEVKTEHLQATIEDDANYQASLNFETLKHPKGAYLCCIPCLKTGRSQIWANNSGGLTGRLREHMEKKHIASYYAKCYQEGLTQRCAEMNLPAHSQPEFTRAMNVVEGPKLRDLILYCGQGNIKDEDVPHRDKLACAAWAMYLLEKNKIDGNMNRARGRISFTSDLWTDASLRSFMAVTAHYIDEYGTLCDHLIAFRKSDGHHSGENAGQALFDVLQESNIVDKV